jgi:DUF971 family protein
MSEIARPATPVEVRRQREENQLRITWDDGHTSDYPLAYLRGWCPCAGCQGHSGERRYVHAADTELANVSVVGRYALNLEWGDGHQTGIYTYRYLRELCPCEECSGEPQR